ncbi:MAG: AIR carboxylase family protein, partial [Rhodobacteraceae bacterium]|nr:AIR carboxylase family protein [Paracoccaceae bacterium]
TALSGLDSLYSILQMPKGYPVATMAIGNPGASNAALLATSILSLNDSEISKRLMAWRQDLSRSIEETPKE